ncbi:MAG: DNA replication and repair protein RecF [candidate division WOR-3 bacterium]|nr:DNA replication and repair protein RecF [candidate division WOR-3 bacterium]MDW8149831.1 DNA replication and repair protein RecF [candidate division WOR-3 bacterium]
MLIKKLNLINFGKFSNFTAEFAEGLNIIVGKNGSGKTTIVEALAYISFQRSFRHVKDEDLLRFGEKEFSITANISNLTEHEIKIIYRKENDKSVKRVYVDNKRQKLITKLHKEIIVLAFHNYNYSIIEQSPASRRYFFDWFFSLIDEEYYINLHRYKKILIQKNKSLKTSKDIKLWNSQLKPYASYINDIRKKYINELNSIIPDEVKIKYTSTLENKTFEDFEEIELKRGFSIVGPHRDMFDFYYRGKNARLYASDGERRKAFFELVNGMVKLVEKTKNVKPVLAFDELFGVLDKDNIKKFIKKMTELDLQVVITAHSKDYVEEFMNIIEIS